MTISPPVKRRGREVAMGLIFSSARKFMAAQLTDQELTSFNQLPAAFASNGCSIRRALIAWNDLHPNSDCEAGTVAARPRGKSDHATPQRYWRRLIRRVRPAFMAQPAPTVRLTPAKMQSTAWALWSW
jgi:hypothetical protein